MLLYGVVGGFGLGLIYLPAVCAVGYYFEKKRALATGISVCGSGVGTFVFAPLGSYLLEQYGWKGANLIFAALCLQVSSGQQVYSLYHEYDCVCSVLCLVPSCDH